jgi:hypothetical protein
MMSKKKKDYNLIIKVCFQFYQILVAQQNNGRQELFQSKLSNYNQFQFE